MTLGQRVAVMRDGVIQQVGAPQTLYAEPANLFVAAFIGSPSMNLVEARSTGTRSSSRVALRSRATGGRRTARATTSSSASVRATSRTSLSEAGLPEIEVEVAVLEELGSEAHAIFPIEAPRVEADDLRAASDEEEEGLIADDARALFNAGSRSPHDRPSGAQADAHGATRCALPFLRPAHRRVAHGRDGRTRRSALTPAGRVRALTLLAAALAAAALAGCGGGSGDATPDGDPGAFMARLVRDVAAGRYERAWQTLHPAHQLVATRERYLSCEHLTPFPGRIASVKVVSVADERYTVPGESESVDSTVVTLRVTLRPASRPGNRFDSTFHAVPVEGHWTWSLPATRFAAYKSGDCFTEG